MQGKKKKSIIAEILKDAPKKESCDDMFKCSRIEQLRKNVADHVKNIRNQTAEQSKTNSKKKNDNHKR